MKLALSTTSILFAVCGLWLVTAYSSWQVAVGLILVMWADNISKELK